MQDQLETWNSMQLRCGRLETVIIISKQKKTMLLSHHGVKHSFHTMDVAVSDWAILEMSLAGPTSVKSASLMKNSLILVTKHCKKKREAHEKEGITVSFFPSSVVGFFFITPWTTEAVSTKAKKNRT